MGSIVDIAVPDIGDFENVEVIEVLVSPGDRIERDASLVTIESDKASMEIPSPLHAFVPRHQCCSGDHYDNAGDADGDLHRQTV